MDINIFKRMKESVKYFVVCIAIVMSIIERVNCSSVGSCTTFSLDGSQC